MHDLVKLLSAALIGAVLPFVGTAQTADQPGREETFASENAVLDTSILFAIGSREARQQLRGAFGWPTYQEGLVEGVYFRFDPDGYARFAPSPRLDTDVFEVICRPRTLVCMGRKDALQVTLNSRGQVQLEMANTSETDQFILADGISELPLPPTILQPLEPRLELLLAAGGEISVRRNGGEVHRISLAGFGAVVPYLRWVAARQDYSVLPRGWPIPNSVPEGESPGLTQTTLWQSPTPQPQGTFAAAPSPNVSAAPVQSTSQNAQVGTDVAEVRGELNVLREMLLGQKQTPTTQPMTEMAPSSQSAQALEARIDELMQLTDGLRQELHQLRAGDQRMAMPFPKTNDAQTAAAPRSNTRDVARHLEYLMTEVGLAPDVALMVVQQAQQSHQADVDAAAQEHDQVVTDILNELRTQLPANAPEAADTSRPKGSGEYQLLSEYFRSVLPE